MRGSMETYPRTAAEQKGHRLIQPAPPISPRTADRPSALPVWLQKSVPRMNGGSVEFSHERRHARRFRCCLAIPLARG